MRKYFLPSILLIVFAAVGYALYVKNPWAHYTWQWHLLQWIPTLSGMVGCMIYGAFLKDDWHQHNGFGKYGLICMPFALAGSIYVIAYNVFGGLF